jgi:hypothetical protein
MQHEKQTYTEPLTNDEKQGLSKKILKDKRNYFIAMGVALVFCISVAYLGAWEQPTPRSPFRFSYHKYEIVFLIAGLFATAILSITYLRFTKKAVSDLKSNTKTVVQHRITKKVYVKNGRSYHLFLDASSPLSIEVNEATFNRYAEGDEISIEYFTCSREYIGYF